MPVFTVHIIDYYIVWLRSTVSS